MSEPSMLVNDEQAAEAAEASLPAGTIWPVLLAVGVFLGLWGIILNSYLFGIGLAIALVSVVGWMWLLMAAAPPETAGDH